MSEYAGYATEQLRVAEKIAALRARDMFAAAALQALIPIWIGSVDGSPGVIKEIGCRAFEYADAMMAKRGKVPR